MNVNALLNADLPTIGRMIASGLRWWTDELATMVPQRLRVLAVAKPALVMARNARDQWELSHKGQIVDRPPSARKAEELLLLLPAAKVLMRDVALPRLSVADTRQLIESDLDRLTPFAAEAVYFDVVRMAGEAGEAGRVRLAVVPRPLADEAFAAAVAAGCHPARVAVDTGDGFHFDLLPSMIAAGRATRPRSLKPWLWGAVAVLLLLNVAILIYRDYAANQELAERIEAQAGRVALVTRARALVIREHRRREALAAMRESSDPLRLLDQLSGAIPAGAWVQQFTAQQNRLEIKGFRPAEADVLAAIRIIPGLSGARNADADFTESADGPLPFAIVADRQSGPVP